MLTYFIYVRALKKNMQVTDIDSINLESTFNWNQLREWNEWVTDLSPFILKGFYTNPSKPDQSVINAYKLHTCQSSSLTQIGKSASFHLLLFMEIKSYGYW